MTLVIAVGPKMPKSPKDTATPEKMKKYGSMPMKKAFELLKRYGAPDKRDLMAALGRTGYKKPGLVEDPEDYKREMAMQEAKEGLRPITDPEQPNEQNTLTNEEMMAADERFRNNNVRTGEPMDLAFRLLKESIDPKKKKFHSMGINEGTISAPRFDPNKQPKLIGNELEELRAARDAARAQLGQTNPNRGGDVDPM